jgi:hypothetical protein
MSWLTRCNIWFWITLLCIWSIGCQTFFPFWPDAYLENPIVDLDRPATYQIASEKPLLWVDDFPSLTQADQIWKRHLASSEMEIIDPKNVDEENLKSSQEEKFSPVPSDQVNQEQPNDNHFVFSAVNIVFTPEYLVLYPLCNEKKQTPSSKKLQPEFLLPFALQKETTTEMPK